jgi:GLPGLI family protein
MKKILLLAGLTVSVLAQAQLKEGRIVYERTVQLPVRMFNADPNIVSQLPKSRTDQFELLFGNNQSLWQYLPSAENEDPGTVSSGGVVLRFASGTNDITYCNFDKGTKTDLREIMDRSYVVSDSFKKGEWKLTDETKTILNYTARKAVGKRINTRSQVSMENGEMKRKMVTDTSVVIAWFSTDIPVSVAPGTDMEGQLPGAILEVDVNNGQTVYKALQVSPKVSVGKIKEPKNGKKLTAAEFTKEREKLMEEMRNNMPGGGERRVIRMQ